MFLIYLRQDIIETGAITIHIYKKECNLVSCKNTGNN